MKSVPLFKLLSVCKRGIANVWTASIQPGDLVEGVSTQDNSLLG